MSIPDLAERIKDQLVILFWPLLWAQMALVGVFLGLIGYEVALKPSVAIALGTGFRVESSQNEGSSQINEVSEKREESSQNTLDSSVKNQPTPQGQTLPAKKGDKPDISNKAGKIVASKNGTKYYPPGCAGANRIKSANKIFFNSTKEAEAAGYSKAKNCK